MNCPLCPHESPNIFNLSKHASVAHKLGARELYVSVVCAGVEPKCACGCGEVPKFWTVNKGFAKYKRGHVARVKNNWGHNPAALAKSVETHRARAAVGDWTVWNKGLTCETDERVAAGGVKLSERLQADEAERARRSAQMKINRLSGAIPTLKGAEHPRWRGGVSSLSVHCHSNDKLYREWKRPKLAAANFQCTRCFSSKLLEVHHDRERMADIVARFAAQFSYDPDKSTHEDRCQIADAVADYHVSAGVSGVVLCSDCHDSEHAAS